jgi:hypothetical protein
MSKVDIKNVSGQILTFATFRDVQIDEVILIADDASLGSEITGIIKESKLNTFQAYIFDEKIQVLEDDIPLTDKEQAIVLFNDEIVLSEKFDETTILRANSLVTQSITDESEGTIVVFENLIEERGVTLLNGEITGNKTATYKYDLELNLDVTKGYGGILETWFEFQHPVYGWIPYINSGKMNDFDKQSEGDVGYSGVLNLIAGIKFRLKIRNTANKTDIRLLATTLTNGVGVVSAGITVH